ncbi:MAG: hypothetical protein V4669_10355 [Pseudomonadota bacterium]
MASISDFHLPRSLLPRIGGMATMPSRMESLRSALPHIVAQVDHLFIYLDKYQAIPPELQANPKITAMLPRPARSGETALGAAGKFLALEKFTSPCLFFGFDDDIRYGEGYVPHLATALRRYAYRCVVGLHGAIYQPAPTSYVNGRHVFNFSHANPFDVLVDELGTGTIAFHSSTLRVSHQRWAEPNQCDLLLMIDAVRQQIPRIALRRPAGVAQALFENQDDSLYRASLVDDSLQTQLLNAAMQAYPGRWCRS